LTVTVQSGQRESVGRIEFLDEDGERVARVVSGATCDEVVSGIALVSALVLDARAESAESEQTEREVSSNPAPQPREPEPPPPQRYGFGVGITGGVESWIGPGAGYFLQGFGEMSGAPLVRRMRLGALRARASGSVADRRTRFTTLAVRVAVCPISFEFVSDLAFTTCLSTDLGTLEAETQRASSLAWVRTARIFWAAAQLRPGVRWLLGRVLALEASGAVGVPLVRHTFVFNDPRQVAFDVPAIGAGAELGMSAQF
jgi:hypothetical protein